MRIFLRNIVFIVVLASVLSCQRKTAALVSMQVALEDGGCDSSVLLVGLSHGLNRPVPYYRELLPWNWRQGMKIEIGSVRDSERLLQQIYPIADYFAMTYDTLLPHDKISGRIFLERICPEIAAARKTDSLFLRWTFTFRSADKSVVADLQGSLGLPRQSSHCP